MLIIALIKDNTITQTAYFEDDTTSEWMDEFCTQLQVDRWEDITEADPRPQVGWSWIEGESPVEPPPPVPEPVRYLSANEFVNRFTLEEWETICGHTSSLAKGFVARLALCPTVDLQDPKLIDVFTRAVTAGILTQERSDEILSGL